MSAAAEESRDVSQLTRHGVIMRTCYNSAALNMSVVRWDGDDDIFHVLLQVRLGHPSHLPNCQPKCGWDSEVMTTLREIRHVVRAAANARIAKCWPPAPRGKTSRCCWLS